MGVGDPTRNVPVAFVHFCHALRILGDHFPSDVANQWLCSMLYRVLGKKLFRRLGLGQMLWLLPYCYISIKSKCWHGPVHVCKKAAHSCVRKIISYASWPQRRRWRSLHRAWDFLLKEAGDSCDAFSLDDAATKLQVKLKSLPHNPSHACARCCRTIEGCQVVVGDAGQFFEMVSSFFVSPISRH